MGAGFGLANQWTFKGSWKCLDREFDEQYMHDLDQFLGSENVYPCKEAVFKAFELTALDDVRVVIVGQDPYSDGSAMGLAFSVCTGKPPPSLHNIYKEIRQDYGCPHNPGGDLTHWATQGVLLLNMALTVPQDGPAGAHLAHWRRFTDAALQCVIQADRDLVFCLWGDEARRLARSIQTAHRHFVLTAGHPKERGNARQPFLGCRHFSMVNALLATQGEPSICW